VIQSDSNALARLRSDLLDAMWISLPTALSIGQLRSHALATRSIEDEITFDATLKTQLKTLVQSKLVRVTQARYLLTDAGRRDRQQAARFLGSRHNPPPEAA
jgi:predicted transcriptional regulator